jgi:hypothetical protein
MKYSNHARRKKRIIPCDECISYAICINEVKTSIVCSILYQYKIPNNRLWKRIDKMFNKRVTYICPDHHSQGYL